MTYISEVHSERQQAKGWAESAGGSQELSGTRRRSLLRDLGWELKVLLIMLAWFSDAYEVIIHCDPHSIINLFMLAYWRDQKNTRNRVMSKVVFKLCED